jgi:hypothetical protein
MHLQEAHPLDDDPRAHIETALGQAFLATRDDRTALPASLARIPSLLPLLPDDDAACLRARYVGQVSWVHNQRLQFQESEALHHALPDTPSTPPYARARRANGLAYALHKLGRREDALHQARLSARHAGDAGHVRLRAMALLMIARVAPDSEEGIDARTRAEAIARLLEDPTIAARAQRSP